MWQFPKLSTATVCLFLSFVPAQALEKMILGHTAGIDPLGAFVAKDQGLFEKHGVDVTFQLATGAGTMAAAVASNSIQASNATVPAMLFAAEQGVELRVIGPIGASAPGFHMAGLVIGGALDLKTAKELEGRTIAVPGLNAFLHILLVKWMHDNGADPGKARFVEITFTQMPDALRAKRIDAATLIDPFLTRALTAGNGKLMSYYTDDLPNGTVPAVWVTSKAFADAKPETVRAFQRGLREGIVYARAHPEIADETLSRYLKLPIEAVRQSTKQPLLDNITPAQIAFWIDLMRAQKLIARPLDSTGLIFKWVAESNSGRPTWI